MLSRSTWRAVRRSSLCARIISSRNLQLWNPPGTPMPLPDDNMAQQVTKVAGGVGFTVMYSDKSPSLWFFGEHPPISGNHQGDGLTEVTLPWKQSVKHVSAGRHHVVAVTTAGKVYTLGLNCFGQCCCPVTSNYLLPLQHIHLPGSVDKVCCGLDHTHFLLNDGRLYSCGWSDDGQTGTSCHGNVTTPTEVIGDEMTVGVRDVQCSADSSIAITEDNSMYGWGNNEYGQLSIKSHDMQVFEPWKVISLPDQSNGSSVVAMAVGYSFSALLTSCGSVYVSGKLGGMKSGGEGEGEERTWRLLHNPTKEGSEEGRKVVGLKSGLHYLTALEVGGAQEGISHHRFLVWGRHSPVITSQELSSSSPTEIRLPSSLVDWDAGPLELCILLE